MQLHVKKILCLIAAMLLCVGLISISVWGADSYTASSMRLLHYEGEVEILDEEGEPGVLLENIRLSSGETLATGEESTASVELDEERIVTLDEETSVEFTQKGDSMVMDLKAGTILLDVEKKLDQNETLDIQTSNMTVGIRGTVVYMSSISSEDEELNEQSASTQSKILALLQQEGAVAEAGTDAEASTSAKSTVTVFGVAQGNADISWTNALGEQKTINIQAGSKAILIGTSGEENYAGPVVAPIEEDDLKGFIGENLSGEVKENLHQILNDQSGSEGDYPYSANGNWSYCGTVTLVAQSASKMYDGTPLMERDILVYGLPSEFTITAVTGGSLTDAGTQENPITDFTVYNTLGENVTSHFPDVETVSGQLVVDPLPLTIWTGSGEKVYDGTPLVLEDAEIKTIPANQEVETGQNISYINTQSLEDLSDVGSGQKDSGQYPLGEDAEVLYGLVGETFVHGTNPLTGETETIKLLAGQRLTVTITNKMGEDSIEFIIEDIKEEQIPEEVLRMYADNPELLEQACEEAEWDIEKIRELIDQLPETKEELVKENGILIRKEDTGSILQDYTNVRIHVDTEITDYDGRSLSSEEASFIPITIDETITVKVTGSQTEVGESINTYELNWENANPANYVVTEELGTLVVYPATVTVTTGSASKIYDGTALTNAEAYITGLVGGERATVTAIGSQTDVGTSKNAYTINWITARPGNYKVQENLGTLTVFSVPEEETTKQEEITDDREIVLTAASGSKTYDGTALTAATVTVSGLPEGFTYEAWAAGSQTYAGSSTNVVAYYQFYDANGNNRTEIFTNVKKVDGILTVAPAPVTITTGSAEKEFDGTALTNGEAVIEGLVTGESVSLTVTGTITDVGTTNNTYRINWDQANADNYTVTEKLGTLTVTPVKATFDLNCYTVEFCGYKWVPETITGVYADESEIECTNLEFPTDDLDHPEAVIGTFHLIGGGVVKLTCNGVKDAGNTTIAPVVEFLAGSAENYEITYINNVMVVTPLEMEFDLGGIWTEYMPIVYDGVAHGGDLGVSSNLEEYMVEQITQNQWQVIWFYGDVIDVQITGGGADAGSHTLSCTYSFSSGNSGNYTVNIVGETQYIDPAPLTITTGSAGKVYDGTPLTNDEVIVEGLVNNETVTVTTDGTITEVGTTLNTYSIIWGTAKEKNYVITDSLGTLEIEAKPVVTITIGSVSKEYDGTPLTGCGDITAEGLPEGYSLGFQSGFILEGSQTEVGSSQIAYDPNGYSILDPSDMPADDAFDVVIIAGYRTVTVLEVTFDFYGYTDTYDEELIYYPEYISGIYDSTEETFEGSFEGDTNTMTATFSLKGGATVVVTVGVLIPEGPGTYYFDPGYVFTSGNPTNYNIKYKNTKMIFE